MESKNNCIAVLDKINGLDNFYIHGSVQNYEPIQRTIMTVWFFTTVMVPFSFLTELSSPSQGSQDRVAARRIARSYVLSPPKRAATFIWVVLAIFFGQDRVPVAGT